MADLAAWLETAPGLVVTEPTPVTVGLEGMQLDLRIDPGGLPYEDLLQTGTEIVDSLAFS